MKNGWQKCTPQLIPSGEGAQMAKALPHEQELYDKIRNEKITVPLVIWDLMYQYLGDDISAITQITLSYYRYDDPVSVESAEKILKHTKRINETVEKILHPEKLGDNIEGFEELKEYDTALHPVINELFFHYIGNDVYGINMIIGFHLDPHDTNPIPQEDARKILDKTFTMMQFLDRLREATNQEVTYSPFKKNSS
jgi:hypothetical protein